MPFLRTFGQIGRSRDAKLYFEGPLPFGGASNGGELLWGAPVILLNGDQTARQCG